MIVGETRRIARGNQVAGAKLYVDCRLIAVPRNGPIPTILLLPRDASWESARRKIHNYRLTKVPTAPKLTGATIWRELIARGQGFSWPRDFTLRFAMT